MPHKFAQADPLFGCLRFGLVCCLRIVCGVGAVVVMHRIIRAGVLTCAVLFLGLLYPARATDLLPEAQQTAKSSEVVPAVPLQNQIRIASPDDSIFFFAGRLSTSNLGSSATFNTIAVDTTLESPYYDNYIVGAAYQHRFRELGSGFVLGGEIGIADRFGHYLVCCGDKLVTQTVTSSNIQHSGELWFGPTIRYESFVLFDQLRITPGITTGFSLTTDSIGAERGKEITRNGNARLLFYLGPEIAFSTVSMPNIELVLRLQHRSGALGTLGHLNEGYNANVVGLRFWY